MTKDPKDIIWEESYGLYYDTFFDELLASRLIGKWKFIDLILKIIIAAAAFLSTSSGLILWNNPAGKIYWFLLSVIVLILATTYLFLNINQKTMQLTRVYKEFMALRYELETFRSNIDMKPEFDVSQYSAQFKAHENTYVEICRHNPYDMLASNDLKRVTQNEINKKLSRIIQKKRESMPPGKISVGGITRGAPYPKPSPKSRQHKYNA